MLTLYQCFVFLYLSSSTVKGFSVPTSSFAQRICGERCQNADSPHEPKYGINRHHKVADLLNASTRRSPFPSTRLFVATDPFTSAESSLQPLPDTTDPYILLRLDPNAQHSKSDMKRAYRRMALLYHPDVRMNASSSKLERARATEDFGRINAAYNFLMGKSDDPTGKTGFASEQKKRKKKEQEKKAQARASASARTGQYGYGYGDGYASYGQSYGGSPAPSPRSSYASASAPSPSTAHASNSRKSGAKSYWDRQSGNGVSSNYASATSTSSGGTNYGAAYGAAYSSPSTSTPNNQAGASVNRNTSAASRSSQQARTYGVNKSASDSTKWGASNSNKSSSNFNHNNDAVNRASSGTVNANINANGKAQGWHSTQGATYGQQQTHSQPSKKRPSQVQPKAKSQAKQTPWPQQPQSQPSASVTAEDRRKWGDFFDADKFHSQWNSSNPNKTSQAHGSVHSTSSQNRHGDVRSSTTGNAQANGNTNVKVNVETWETWSNGQSSNPKSVDTTKATSSQVRKNENVSTGSYAYSKVHADNTGSSTQSWDGIEVTTTSSQKSKSYGDFYDADRFHSQWNSFHQGPTPAQEKEREQLRLEVESKHATKVQERKKKQEEEERKKREKEEAERVMAKKKISQEMQEAQQKEKSSSDEGGWNGFVKAVSNFFQPKTDQSSTPATKKTFTKPSQKVSKADTSTSVPSPPRGQQYSPYEACSILETHDLDPKLDKPAAMRIMLEEHYVPVKRSQLYRVYRMYKEGKIALDHRWGQYH